MINNLKYSCEALYQINIHQDINRDLAYKSLREIFDVQDKKARNSLLVNLLSGIMCKGATVDEVTGLIEAALSVDEFPSLNSRTSISLPNNEKLLGLAGSGKKGIKTKNISTSSAIVAASCGAYVAKACSSGTSSKTGSSDFLSMIGIKNISNLDKNIEILKKNNLAFFSIEASTPKFAEIYGGIFYAPHAMSYALAGLSLPIKVDVLAYGLAHNNVKLSANVFKNFRVNDVLVYGTTLDNIHYIDEIAMPGNCTMVRLHNDKIKIKTLEFNKDLKIQCNDIKSILEIDNKKENVAHVVRALKNLGPTELIDNICLNSGLYLYLTRKSKDIFEGYSVSKKAIKEGRAIQKLIETVTAYGGTLDFIYKAIKGY